MAGGSLAAHGLGSGSEDQESQAGPLLQLLARITNISFTSNGTTAVEHQSTIEFRFPTLPKVKRKFSGTYFCEIKNPANSRKSQSLNLDILYGPDAPILFPQDSIFQEGSNIRISCESDSHPKATYTWTFNGEPWSSSKEININKAARNHSGVYVCTAFNAASNMTHSTAKNLTVYAVMGNVVDVIRPDITEEKHLALSVAIVKMGVIVRKTHAKCGLDSRTESTEESHLSAS